MGTLKKWLIWHYRFRASVFSDLLSSHHYPSIVGALLCVTVSSYLGPFKHSLQFLHHRLSLIADNFSIGCSVGWVELYSRVFWSIWNQIDNLFRLNSLSPTGFLVGQQFFRFKVACASTYFEDLMSNNLQIYFIPLEKNLVWDLNAFRTSQQIMKQMPNHLS